MPIAPIPVLVHHVYPLRLGNQSNKGLLEFDELNRTVETEEWPENW